MAKTSKSATAEPKAPKAKGKVAAAPETNGEAAEPKAPRVPKGGLPRPQLRVLKALAESKTGFLTKADIVKKTGVNDGIIGNAIGRFDDEARAKQDAELKRDSLLTAGLIRIKHAKSEDDDKVGPTMLEITAAGRKAWDKAKAEFGGKLPPKAPAPFSKTAKPDAE